MLAAGDTFRAAAIDQLELWGERVGAPVIAHEQGADPGAVVFDAMQAAHARDVDVLIVDTAGRLHTKHNLMAELSKTPQDHAEARRRRAARDAPRHRRDDRPKRAGAGESVRRRRRHHRRR